MKIRKMQRWIMLFLILIFTLTLTIPVIAQTKIEDIKPNPMGSKRFVVIDDTNLDMELVPELKLNQKVDTKNEKKFVKEIIGERLIVHQLTSKKKLIEKARIASPTTLVESDTYWGENYVVYDYIYDPIIGWFYAGAVELDTTWYTNSGIITSASNIIWGSVPYHQKPDYWTRDDDDVDIYNNNTQAVSWGQATKWYLAPYIEWNLGSRTYRLETDIDALGNRTNSYSIISTG